MVRQERCSRAATSSQPLVRTTASSEHNGQRCCLSAFEQTKRNHRTKRRRVSVAVKRNNERERKRARERERERERHRVLLGSLHVCGGHTGNEGARSRNVARSLHCHLGAQKASGYPEARISAMYHSTKSGIDSLALARETRFYIRTFETLSCIFA